MRLLAITRPEFWDGEADAVCRLLGGGWERVHVRKPQATADEIAALLEQIPERYRSRLSLHDHFELAARYGIGGVHLNGRNPQPPAGWRGLVSRSCHSPEEVLANQNLDYLTLSPIYDSISKPGYMSRFNLAELSRAKLPLNKVYALGGVQMTHLAELSDAGFGGAAMLSEAWAEAAMLAKSAGMPQQKNIAMEHFELQYITPSAERLEEVLRGGCRWVQLRMKDASDEEFAQEARKVVALCREYGATVIFDDRVELVKPLGADGVHLGKNDMPVDEARRLLGPDVIIGATANTAEDALNAWHAGADYLGIGPYRFTTTKKGLAPVLGLEGYRTIMARLRAEGMPLPVVAIGGILVEDLEALHKTGVNGVAVSGLILRSENPETTTQEIISNWSKLF